MDYSNGQGVNHKVYKKPGLMVKTQDIVVMYTQEHLTMEQIGNRVGMSRQAVRKRLVGAGVSAQQGTWVSDECYFCGRPLVKVRCRTRRSKHHFCQPECYYAFRENPHYKPWRQGQRLARAVVSQYFTLPPKAIVHHKDGNNRNNDLDNLMVYASVSDHTRMHHGASDVTPLWDGSNIASVKRCERGRSKSSRFL